MTMTVDAFRARFPDFADETKYTDERLQLLLNEALRWFKPDVYGDSADDAQGLMAAYLLTGSSGAAAGAGLVQSVSAGGASVTYAIPTMSAGGLRSTNRYASMFDDLTNRVVVGGAVSF